MSGSGKSLKPLLKCARKSATVNFTSWLQALQYARLLVTAYRVVCGSAHWGVFRFKRIGCSSIERSKRRRAARRRRRLLGPLICGVFLFFTSCAPAQVANSCARALFPLLSVGAGKAVAAPNGN